MSVSVSPKLDGCDPGLVERVSRVIAAMTALGFPMRVTDGLRTDAQQQALYAQGRSAPGPVVTHADGITKRSKHQDGKAADCAFWIDGKPSWSSTLPWDAYGACAKAVGLRWGGDFKSLKDRPHVEL